MVKLKRLKIRRYRDVEPCELVFSDRFNVLLGPNGAGKTTLLNLISKVLRTTLGDPTDPLSIEVELSFDGGMLTGTIETADDAGAARPEFPPEIHAAMAARPGVFRALGWPMFELRVTRFEPPITVEVRRTGDVITIGRRSASPEIELALRDMTGGSLLDLASTLASSVTRVASGVQRDVWNALRFDESLDMFRAMTARQDDLAGLVADFRIHLLGLFVADKVNQEKLDAFPVEGMVPRSVLDMIASRFTDGAKDVSCDHGDLPFLAEAVRLMGLRAATAKLELTDKKVFAPKNGEKGTENFHFGNLKFWFTRKDGSIFQDQLLSYGQKRLLTFLYYLDCNPSFVIADELVNGLHHAWIEECVKAIGERQAFLTSQNPLLLDYLAFASVQEVKETFILCRNDDADDRERMIWRNLTDDEAEMFYSAYNVGIEHVGEILRTRGLW